MQYHNNGNAKFLIEFFYKLQDLDLIPDIQNLNLKEFARKVAIVQQYNSASDDITVENLVAFGRTPHKKMMQGDSAEDERMIEWALEVTNLMEYRDREVSRLSGYPDRLSAHQETTSSFPDKVPLRSIPSGAVLRRK